MKTSDARRRVVHDGKGVDWWGGVGRMEEDGGRRKVFRR